MNRCMPRTLPSRSVRLTASGAALVLGAVLAAGCAHMPWSEKPPQSAEITQNLTATATVVAVDASKRLITLRDARGVTSVVHAGPEVRNFAQIAPGDTVKVRYQESLVFTRLQPGVAAAPPSAEIVAGRAKPGQKPGAMMGGQLTTTVKVELVDADSNIVVFTPPDGGLRAVRAVRPEGQQFIRGLAPGDQVEITYTEALAVSVDKQ
jgi:hypothetical protein